MSGILDCRKSVFAQNVNQLIGIESENILNVKRIELTMGYFALADKEDFEFLSQWKWHPLIQKHNVYAVRRFTLDGKRKMQLMHRDVLRLWFNDGTIVDHRDLNGLHNCKSNLRITSYSINGHNHRMYSNNKSGYRGVSFFPQNKRWIAQIGIHGNVYIGSYSSPEEAAIAYNNAAIQHYGNDAVLNVIKHRKE